MAEGSRIQVLLAEDNRAHQQLLLAVLSRGGPRVEVTVVDTGREFLRAIRLKTFDCAVLNYRLPDYRADELLELAAKELPFCPVVVTSGRTDQDVVVSSIRQGGTDYISKERALSGNELWLRVEAAIAQQHKREREQRRKDRRKRLAPRQAENDRLTGLSCRQHFGRCLLNGRWAHDRRQPLAVAMLDIDYMTRINDMFGQTTGDAVLKVVAGLVRESVGEDDLAARWGGGEFLVVTPIAAVTDGWLWAERLRQRVEAMAVVVGTNRLHATVSIGVLLTRGSELGPMAIGVVNAALACAKEHGRNTVYTADMAAVMRELEIVANQTNGDSTQRRHQFLARLSHSLGPTQLEHITDHCERVSEMAVRMARRMPMSSDEVEQIRMAGLTHDIGKCLIPEELLAKPGPLTYEERRLMSQHERFGERIARELGFSETCIAYLRGHHLRHDDCHVPQVDGGPAGSPVPLGARVLCVADALVTMLSNRKYQPARPVGAALEELHHERGRQFDPTVVDTVDMIDSLELLAAA